MTPFHSIERLRSGACLRWRAMRKIKKVKAPVQLSLARTTGHGGRRAGAGRKKKDGRGDVAHAAREKLQKKTPVHVTLRAYPGRATLRRPAVRAMFEDLVRVIGCEAFRIVVYSLQRDHLHLICEPRDERALSTAMRRLAIRFSLRLNAVFGRPSGRHWSGRYHRHDLTTPREVRNALVYVLLNGKKHGEAARDAHWMDPYSSAAEFDGWRDGASPPRRACGSPRFWLLAVGWRRHGLLSPTEAPGLRCGR